jgi:hypothetical protein
MAKPVHSFLFALIVSVAAPAATPRLDCLCHSETTGLTVIDHGDLTSDSDLPVGARRLLPGLQGVAARIYRATGIRDAVLVDHGPTLQVPPSRRLSMRDNHRSWIDDANVLTQQAPRGPPSV